MDNPRNPLNNSDSQNQYKQPVRKAPSENQRSVGRSASSSYQKKQTEEKIYAQPPRSFKRGEPAEQKKTKKETEKRPPRKRPEEMTPEMIRAEKRKAAKRKMIARNFGRVSVIMVVVVAISVFLASIAISCVNDVLALHIPEEKNVQASVVIVDNMDTASVIDTLADAGLIRNAWFCKFAASFIGYSDEGYIPRTYDLMRSMGLENMLNEIKNNTSKTAKTVKLTFPEGYNVDQIIEMLEENNVCSRAKFVEAMNTADFTADFEFLTTMADVESRYMKLEGYLFPDTYEFYLGEDPVSVIKKFLNNFDKKWNSDYAEKAQSLRLTVDQVVKLASVIEKEAVGADMPVVGSILHNRLDANMRLECDSTSIYIKSNKSGLSQEMIDVLEPLYDTYVCRGMPVGAICNPGVDSIDAVLNAPDTDYYYFIHDANNEFHVAKTLSEQEYNIATYGLAE